MFGPLSEEQLKARGLHADFLPMDESLRIRGSAFMDAFRATAGVRPGQERGDYYSVGGQLQLCTVSKSGTSMEAIGYWPDPLGEPINPGRAFRRFALP